MGIEAMVASSPHQSGAFRHDLESSPHHAGEVAFLQSIAEPGMVVIEGGSHNGVTALALAEAVGEAGQVHAFEPVPEYYSELRANLSRHGARNVSPYELALSDQTGRIPFYKRDDGSGITPAGGGEKIWVEATTVTEFAIVEELDRVDLLHLDCEGSELLVFRGGRSVLEKHRPQVFCEVHRGYLDELGQSVEDVLGYLHGLGYETRLVQVENLDAETSTDRCSHVYARAPVSDS